jgi:hypothetical protein
VIIRRLIVPLTMAALAVYATQAHAQNAFPAPLPGRMAAPDPAFPPVNGDPAFPPVNGAAPTPAIGRAPGGFPSNGAPPVSGGFSQPAPQAGAPNDACMNGFLPLRQDAEKRGAMIKTASEHHAPPDEACKLIGNFAQSEVKMINYVESHAEKCGIPPQVGTQLKMGHKNTEKMLKQVCDAAKQPRGPAGPSLSDVLGSSAALPEATVAKKSGGSTFDTLNGNVLTR